jgi:hypothetical protein
MFESFYKIHLQIRLAKKINSLSSRWTYSGGIQYLIDPAAFF